MKNHFVVLMLLACSAVFLTGLRAQPAPVGDTLRANSIHARLQSNGAFFLGGDHGEFRVPAVTGGAPEISLLKSAGLWIGGRDAAGTLHLAAQLYNENGQTDFYPGVVLAPGVFDSDFNLVAGVTRADVLEHQTNPAPCCRRSSAGRAPATPTSATCTGSACRSAGTIPGPIFTTRFSTASTTPSTAITRPSDCAAARSANSRSSRTYGPYFTAPGRIPNPAARR